MIRTSSVAFRGQSGRSMDFRRVHEDSYWARKAGVALFAARDTFGWRIIRLVEMTGQTNNVQPIWALLDAKRFGASAIFVHDKDDFRARRAIIADLEAGFSPVCPDTPESGKPVLEMAA